MRRLGLPTRDRQYVTASYALAPGLEWRATIGGLPLGAPATVLVEAYLSPALPQDDWLRRHGAYALHTQVLFPSLLVGVEAMLRDEHQWRLGNATRAPPPLGQWTVKPLNDARKDVRLTASREPDEDWYVLNHMLDRTANEFFSEEPRFLARWSSVLDERHDITDLVEYYAANCQRYHNAITTLDPTTLHSVRGYRAREAPTSTAARVSERREHWRHLLEEACQEPPFFAPFVRHLELLLGRRHK